MRGLELQDMFTMARILTKIDINKEIEALVKRQQAGEKLDTEAVGIQFVMTVIGKASTEAVEAEIYGFLGSVFGMEPDELRHMKPKQALELIKEADAQEWKDFFISVARLVRQQS